ncbi:MAG: hypothetical protein HUU19_14860 [Phycisphaerales bacterium]|nr:hypothetical protein [Phycisphaerales bacterium]
MTCQPQSYEALRYLTAAGTADATATAPATPAKTIYANVKELTDEIPAAIVVPNVEGPDVRPDRFTFYPIVADASPTNKNVTFDIYVLRSCNLGGDNLQALEYVGRVVGTSAGDYPVNGGRTNHKFCSSLTWSGSGYIESRGGLACPFNSVTGGIGKPAGICFTDIGNPNAIVILPATAASNAAAGASAMGDRWQ